jgi:hypothetical protein
MSPRSGSIALLAATVLYGLQLAVYYPELPDRVASHFDAAGNPDGSMSKAGFLALTLALGVGDCLLFLGLAGMNLGDDRRLSPGAFWSLLGGYLLCVAVWLWQFARRFREPA